MNIPRLSVIGLLFALVVVSLSAAADSRILTSVSPQQVVKLLADAGLPAAQVDKDGDVIVVMYDKRVLVLVNSEKNEAIQFRFSISGSKATLRSVNDWNRTNKFTKGYLDDDGDPTLEMDLDFAGGVTEARVIDAIKTFQIALKSFIDELRKLR